jgi:hypothetical protein
LFYLSLQMEVCYITHGPVQTIDLSV